MAKVNAENMMPISIHEFITGVVAPVDVYIRLSAEKFVLICKQGQKAEKSQLTSYKDRSVDYLWVEKRTYGKLTRQNIAIAGIVVNKENFDVGHKTKLVTAAATSVFNELDNMGINLETYSHAKEVTEATVALVETHRDLATLFKNLAQCSDSILGHSMAVSAVSVIIGQAMGWTNKNTLEKLALGGLLHDVGKKTLPPELLDKPKIEMTYDELQVYETHPFKGMELLQSLGIVPDDVVSIVYEHHENSIGQGYPQKLRNLKIHPLARVVALGDEFVNLTVKNPNCPVPKTPREALLYIEHTMGQPYNKEAFQALETVITHEGLKTSA